MPCMKELLAFQRDRLPQLHGGGAQYSVPVLLIRWPHDAIDSRATFAHDFHAGQSIYKLQDQVQRGIKSPHDFEP